MTGPERIKWGKMKEQRGNLAAVLAEFAVNTEQPLEAMWNEAVAQIHQVGARTLGKTKPGRKYIDKQTWWWNEEVQKALENHVARYRLGTIPVAEIDNEMGSGHCEESPLPRLV